MKKLVLVLVLALVVLVSGCESNDLTDTKIKVTQYETGEITVCIHYEYEDGTRPYTCDLFMLDTSDLQDQIDDLQEQLDNLE